MLVCIKRQQIFLLTSDVVIAVLETKVKKSLSLCLLLTKSLENSETFFVNYNC